MKKLMVVLLVVMLSTVVFAAPASAGPPIEVSGTVNLIESEPPNREDMGANCIVTFDGIIELTEENDLIVGTASSSWRIVAKRECAGSFPGKSNESLVVKGTCTDCIVDGVQGDFDFNYNSRVREGGAFSGKFIIVKGYGDLANLHGVLTATSDNVLDSISYTGRIHFAP